MCFEIYKGQWDKDQSLKKRMKTIQELDFILPIVQMTPSELTCRLSASLPQSALSENSVWLFYSEGTGNSSTVCPIGYLDNINAQNIEHTPPGHATHTPDEKVTKAGILLCSHQQQERDMRSSGSRRITVGFYRAVGESSLFSLQAEETVTDLDKLQSLVCPPRHPLPGCFFTILSSSEKGKSRK